MAVCVAGALFAATAAQGAIVEVGEIRPGVPALFFTANAGEPNDVAIRPKGRISTSTDDLGLSYHVITVVDEGSTLTTGGSYPCVLLSAHKARCTSFANGFSWIQFDLRDGPDRLSMPARVGYPTTLIYSDGGGNRFTVRGPSTEVYGAFTGDVVRFKPPGGGGVITGGSPTLKLVDGAPEYVDCRPPGTPRVFSDPLDSFSSYCSV
ncbi:MAG: hypothetical protein ACJ760_08895 [Thermoleophilaceae bacterium]